MGSEELLLEAGKSSELTACLHTLSETDVEGEPKFSPMICREIGKIIVCRTYATPILELCHLLLGAAKIAPQPDRYELLFWDSGVARTSSFHNYCDRAFEHYTGSRLQINGSGLTINYDEGPFSIQFSRMPVLSALLEFLLSALGYCEIDETVQSLLKNNASKKSISECANALSRQVYGYLREHLPTAQSQRKFRKILTYCQDDIDQINDDLILHFWQEASLEAEKGIDFKTFDSVFLTFIRAIQAVEAARDLSSMRYAGSIGSNREAGEIDPDILSESLDCVDEAVSSLLKLSTSPLNLIKFLNKQETAHLETLLHSGNLALRLPLSVLRSDVFSKPQSRLTQALRRKAKGDDLQTIIQEGPKETYQERRLEYKSLREHLERSIYASLHALVQAESKNLISVLLKFKPHVDFSVLTSHLIQQDQADNVISLHQPNIANRFISLLHDPQRVGAEITRIMDQAEQAHGSISRKGFKEDPKNDPDLVHAFHEGADLLLDIAQDIDNFLKRLDQLDLTGGQWSSQFSYDRRLFSSQFTQIYGDAS